MEDKYIISVSGTQTVDGEKDTVELTTTAAYIERNGKKFIKYREYSDDGSDYITTVLKIEENRITITKKLDRNSQMILECGKRHQCAYYTPIGNMTLGVYTESMSGSVDENGGHIEVCYTIDFNADLESCNTIKIDLRKK